MLGRSQIKTILMLHQWEGTLFSTLPLEVMIKISDNYVKDSASDAAKLLKSIVDADLKAVKAMLDANPHLLLRASDVLTRAGLFIKRVKPYECALGAADPEMATLVGSYFSQITDGENDKTAQSKRYKLAIDAMLTQKPDDLTGLFKIVMESSEKDIFAELFTGDKYDKSHTSKLRDALNQFRAAKLDPKVRIITEPRMHCNYQNLIHAYELLDTEWSNLYRESGNNYNKIDLIARQIIGFIQLVELPGLERCLFAGGQIDEAAAGREINRSYDYRFGVGRFPDFKLRRVDSHSGVGFDSYVSIYGRALVGVLRGGLGRRWRATKLMLSKNFKLAELMLPQPRPKTSSCVIS